MTEDLKKATKLCQQACDDIYMKYDVDLSYDYFDCEVKTFYLFESEHSANRVKPYMLEELRNQISNINKRWYVGIKRINLEAWEASQLSSKLKNKKF